MAKHRDRRQYSKVVWPGFSNAPLPRQIKKVGRNEPCVCGSGKKYKDCHEPEGEAFLEQMAIQENKQRLKELRLELKSQGVPWYKRFFFRR